MERKGLDIFPDTSRYPLKILFPVSVYSLNNWKKLSFASPSFSKEGKRMLICFPRLTSRFNPNREQAALLSRVTFPSRSVTITPSSILRRVIASCSFSVRTCFSRFFRCCISKRAPTPSCLSVTATFAAERNIHRGVPSFRIALSSYPFTTSSPARRLSPLSSTIFLSSE